MIETSDTYQTLIATDGHEFEVRLTIGDDVYGMDKLVSLSTPQQLFSGSGPSIGCAVAGELEAQFYVASTPAKAAEVTPAVRVVVGSQASEWVSLGTYFIDSRSYDSTGELLTIHCYDPMLKGEAVYLDAYPDEDNADSWPQLVEVVFPKIATAMGVSTDLMTELGLASQRFYMTYPGNDTLRDMLCQIGAAYGGNFIIDGTGALRFIELKKDAAVDQALGYDVENFTRGDAYAAFTKVTLSGDDGDFTSGTSDGSVVEADCPWATQAIADYSLSVIDGWTYYPFEATKAFLDPAIERGDTISCNGYTSLVGTINRDFSKLCLASVEAPEDEELNHEYPYLYGGYKGSHSLAGLDEVIDQINDLSDQVVSIMGEIGTGFTSAIDFTDWDSGAFTETISTTTTDEDDTVTTEVGKINYTVSFDTSGNPVRIQNSDGRTVDITW